MKARVHLREVVFAAGGEMAAASSARCFRESMRACGARPALPGRTRRLREDGSEKSVRLRCRWYVAEQLLRFEPCQLSLLNLCARLGRELFEGEDGRAQRRTTLRRRHCGVEVEDDGRALRHRMLGRAGGRGGSVRDPVRWRKSGENNETTGCMGRGIPAG